MHRNKTTSFNSAVAKQTDQTHPPFPRRSLSPMCFMFTILFPSLLASLAQPQHNQVAPSAMGLSLPKCQFLGNQAGTRAIGAKCHLNANEQVPFRSINRALKVPVYILNAFLGLTRLNSTTAKALLHLGAPSAVEMCHFSHSLLIMVTILTFKLSYEQAINIDISVSLHQLCQFRI